MEETQSQLVALAEASLRLEPIRWGHALSNIRLQLTPTTYPYTLVGRTVDGPLRIFTSPSQSRTVAKGGVYLIPAGLHHWIDPLTDQRRWYHWAHVQVRVLGHMNLFDLLESPLALPASVGPTVQRITLGFAAAAQAPTWLARAAQRQHWASQLLSLLVAHCQPRHRTPQSWTAYLRLLPVFQWLTTHDLHDVHSTKLAAVAHLSSSRLHALFITAVGLAPMQYVQDLRLKKAQELLLATDLPIHQIAAAAGFADPFHFSRLFKRHTTLSPRFYRRQAQRQLHME